MPHDHNHLNYATWELRCRVHAEVRNKVLLGQIRRHLGTVFHELARRWMRNDPRLYQEPRDGRQAAGSVATEACVLMKSQLLSQSPSNPQLCWGLLALSLGGRGPAICERPIPPSADQTRDTLMVC